MENRAGVITLNGTIYNQSLLPIRVPVVPAAKFVIDTINIGIITNKKNSVETLLTVSNSFNCSVFIEEVEISNKPRTAMLKKIDNVSNEVKPMTAFNPIALIRVFSSNRLDVKLVRTVVKIRYSTQELKGQTTELEFAHVELHNPLSSIERRYIKVDRNGKEVPTRRPEDVLLLVKNSLNLPLKLTMVIIDETKFKVTWLP